MRQVLMMVLSLSLAVPVLAQERKDEQQEPAADRGTQQQQPAAQDRGTQRPARERSAGVNTAGLKKTDSEYALSPQQALWAKISEVKFEQTPLRDALAWVQEVLGTNMHVDWGSLAEAGVTPEQPINVNLKWVRVPRLLQFIFQETGRGDALTYHIADNILVITSKEKADAELFTRVYPVQDLVIQPSKVDRVDRSVLAPSVNGGGSGDGRFGGDRNNRNRRGDDDDDDDDSDQDRGEQIVEMVKKMTPADIWEENGGKSKITYYRGNLILTAPRSVHALVGGPIRE